MTDEGVTGRMVSLLERQIALDLYFRGASQGTIARVLGKSKSWVNGLLKGVPKGGKG